MVFLDVCTFRTKQYMGAFQGDEYVEDLGERWRRVPSADAKETKGGGRGNNCTQIFDATIRNVDTFNTLESIPLTMLVNTSKCSVKYGSTHPCTYQFNVPTHS